MVRAKTGSRMVKWTGAKEGVRTDADALVNIAGGLRAVGTQSDSIRFLPGFAGKWRGIEVWSNPLIIQGDSAITPQQIQNSLMCGLAVWTRPTTQKVVR